MAAITYQRTSAKKGIDKRLLIIIGIVAIIVIIFLIFYVDLTIQLLLSGLGVNSALHSPSQISALLKSQELLNYQNAQQYVPYLLINYTAHNVSQITINATLFKSTPPSRIFLLNTSNECYNCGNVIAIEDSFYNNLIKYDIIKNSSQVQVISISNVRSIPNDSVLVVLNGLLPSSFLSVQGNVTTLQYLLNRQTSIVYVGDDFSQVLLPQSIVTSSQTIPIYLLTMPPRIKTPKTAMFFFNSSTYFFINGTTYANYTTYENIANGSIAAFPNTPNSWASPNQTGSDIAKAVEQLYWLPKYAYGTRTVNTLTKNSIGNLGILLNAQNIPFNSVFAANADKGDIRAVVSANAVYISSSSNSVYQYINVKPEFHFNGTMSMQSPIIVNQSVPFAFDLLTHSATPISIEPHITIYTLNFTEVSSTPLPFINNVSSNFTFFQNQLLDLAPGASYIVKLQSFYGTEYMAGLLNVSPINITLLEYNLTIDKFLFSITSQKHALSNINYSMELNNLYPQNGTIKNGQLLYAVPSGTPTLTGNLNFQLNVKGGNSYFVTSYNPISSASSEQEYIVISVVVILMLVMIIFVKSPNRDEFYIDALNLPEEKKTSISLKPNDVIEVFDKLNISYHWRYMPLSKAEIKSAISTNIRYNNIPVGLTYNNIEKLLNQLIVKKYLVSADELYAPMQWTKLSGHDIEYLATFKKLRIYLVTHAYIFTDLDMSTNADMVATFHNQRKYIVIDSKTSKFQKVPIYAGSKTYIVFINSYRMEEFRTSLYDSSSAQAEELKMYMSADYVKLVDADNLEGLLD